MGKSRIKLELIQDHKKRKTTFLKRKAGLCKKVSQLSILCDIKACMILYQENIHGVDDQQEIWPNDPKEVEELINCYKKQPLEDRSKRTENLSNFFENQKKKVKSEVAKLKKERTKHPTWDSRFDTLSEVELKDIARVLEEKIENTKRKFEFLKSNNNNNDQEVWDYPELMNQTPCPTSYGNNNIPFIDNKWFQEFMTSEFQEIPSSNVNDNGMLFQEFMTSEFQEFPSSVVNSMDNGNLFQEYMTSDQFQVIPSSGVNYMDNGQHTVADYQFGINAENWLMNNDFGAGEFYFGSSSMMQQPMELLQLEYPNFTYNDSTTQMPYNGF